MYCILAYSLQNPQKRKCLKPELDIGFKLSIEECADTCTGISSLIAYGTNDYGRQGCNDHGGCSCLCEWAATYSGKCKIAINKAYRLFKIPMKSKYYFVDF